MATSEVTIRDPRNGDTWRAAVLNAQISALRIVIEFRGVDTVDGAYEGSIDVRRPNVGQPYDGEGHYRDRASRTTTVVRLTPRSGGDETLSLEGTWTEDGFDCQLSIVAEDLPGEPEWGHATSSSHSAD